MQENLHIKQSISSANIFLIRFLKCKFEYYLISDMQKCKIQTILYWFNAIITHLKHKTNLL